MNDLPESSLDITPERILQEALNRSKTELPDKAVVLFLWDADRQFEGKTQYLQSGMNDLELIGSLDIIKHSMINRMEERPDAQV